MAFTPGFSNVDFNVDFTPGLSKLVSDATTEANVLREKVASLFSLENLKPDEDVSSEFFKKIEQKSGKGIEKATGVEKTMECVNALPQCGNVSTNQNRLESKFPINPYSGYRAASQQEQRDHAPLLTIPLAQIAAHRSPQQGSKRPKKRAKRSKKLAVRPFVMNLSTIEESNSHVSSCHSVDTPYMNLMDLDSVRSWDSVRSSEGEEVTLTQLTKQLNRGMDKQNRLKRIMRFQIHKKSALFRQARQQSVE